MQKEPLSLAKKFAVLGILLISFLLGLFSLRGDSAIVDEIAHIPAGYNYVVDGDYRLNPEHPPLVKALSGVPLVFLDLTFPYDLEDWKTIANGQWESGWKFLYERGNDPDQILFWSRIPTLLSFMVLLVFMFAWARNLWGDRVAFLALGLGALAPNLLAHARYVTTDMGVVATFFIAIYCFWRYLKKPSWKWLIWTMVAFAIAQLAKYSNALLPIYMVLLSVSVWFAWLGQRIEFPKFPFVEKIKSPGWQRAWVLLASLALMFVGGFLLVWIGYIPFVWNTPPDMLHQLVDVGLHGAEWDSIRGIMHGFMDNVVTRPMAQYVLGLLMVMARVTGGNTTYFMGEVTNQSFLSFYPLSFLMKTPIPMLLGLLGTLVLLLRGVWRLIVAKALPKHVDVKATFESWWKAILAAVDHYLPEFIILTTMAMFMVVGIAGNLNIGLRHILPLYPFMILLVAKYGVAVWDGSKGNIRKVILILLLVWYAGGTLVAFPHYLSYFNEAIGTKNAYNYTTDSNLDWGQDLKRLALWAEEEDIQALQVDYFGGGVPEYYLGDRYIEWHANNGETTGWIAVSATFYQNGKWYSQCCGELDYTWLEKYEPVEVIGGSILVFEVPE